MSEQAGLLATCVWCEAPVERCHDGCKWRHRRPGGRLEESCGLFATPQASTIKPREAVTS